MGEQRKPIDLQGIIGELISAISALNMGPEPLAEPAGPLLAQRDRWATHCGEHLEAALEGCLEVLDQEISALDNAFWAVLVNPETLSPAITVGIRRLRHRPEGGT